MRSLLVKIALMAVVDAIAVFAILTLFFAQAWVVGIVVALVTLALNGIYLGRRAVPAKYLAPGVILLVTFNLFIILFTGYISLTNYGQGHVGSKSDAIAALESQNLVRVEESPQYQLTVLDKASEIWFLVTDPQGVASLGSATTPLTPAPTAELDDTGKAIGIPGYEALQFKDILGRQAEITGLAVPISDDTADGALKTADGRTAYLYRAELIFVAALDAMVDTTTNEVFPDNGRGAFGSADGSVELLPGWVAVIGLDNFATVVTESTKSGQFAGVLLWTFTFAVLSVAIGAGMGVFLALVFNDPRIRGRRIYRVLMIVPYGFPAFLSILIWGGMMNTEFGFINKTLLGGVSIPWLDDPTMAKVSLLLVSLWLEFPYYFLVATGALQSIPAEVEEAATMDGASRWRLFRSIRMPLLLVSLAPLLISAFAFAFNNFTLVWLLTGGRPVPVDSVRGIGSTDILITVVYKVAFGTTGVPDTNYGLASAYAVVIFVIVAVVAVWSFRRTKRLEEIF